jgi:hypothetical protein
LQLNRTARGAPEAFDKARGAVLLSSHQALFASMPQQHATAPSLPDASPALLVILLPLLLLLSGARCGALANA